ncbi:MAG: Conserved exported or envelope protein of unknown function [Frankiales bacterium]|nr:Conserved exported or envelope protein of unknown function [Frankiales bacterium]
MRRLLLVALLIALGLPASALADPVAGPVRVVQQGGADVTATCRRDLPATDEQCALPIAPPVTEQALADYQRSDTHRRLALQYALGNDVPFGHAAWLGTHNSFNTTTRPVTVSGLDSNQQLSLTDQLRSDIRSVELDAHWFPSLSAGGRKAPVMCHARGQDQAHAGCTTEALLTTGLAEVARWLRANPRQVVLLYLEDQLDTDEGYAAGAAAVRHELGPLLYAPGGTGCTPLPLDGTRNDVLAAHKQVLVISSCHGGAGWNGAIFSEAAKIEDGPAGYGDNGACDAARPPRSFDDRFLRVFEDSTALTATVDQGANRITPGQAKAFQRCGVDVTGFDQLMPGDPRLTASAWSWAPSQPATGGCAVEMSDGFHTTSCSSRQPYACRTARGWTVDLALGPAAGRGRCKGGQVGTPRYGWEAVQLQTAMRAARVPAVWVSMTGSGTQWKAHDRVS